MFDYIFSGSLGIVLAILFIAVEVINVILAFTIIFLERKDPSSTLAWILVLFLFPIIGILIYITFSQNISRRKIFKLTDKEIEFNVKCLRNQMKSFEKGDIYRNNQVLNKWKDLIRLNQVAGSSYFTGNNHVDIITDGKKKFEMLINDIRKAKESVHVQYFIIKKDVVGLKLLKVLTDKAKAGVDVKLLVDDIGSRNIIGRPIEEFLEAGGKFASFFPQKLLFHWQVNYRNHRKIVVIDNRVAYVGGFNIAKEYLGLKKKFGYWRDTHLRIEGGAAQDLNGRILLDWRFAANNSDELFNDKIFLPIKDTKGNKGIQIVSSGPDDKKQEIKQSFMKMITSSKEKIYIQTPYFVPDDTILETLKMVVQSGVDVRIMIPSIPDHMFVYWATFSYVGELLEAGARIYIYDNGFLHAKTMVCDGEVATVGSANFDRRSFRLNFETNAFIFDEDIALKLEKEFLKDIDKSHELTKELYDSRSLMIRIKEPISRLLSDIL